jgi:simple sugar transport system permease protein
MTGASPSAETATTQPPGPTADRSRDARLGFLGRFLTLREGSIIVVTLITIIYFSVTTSHFLTGGNFKTILPYFAPLAIIAAGEVFVMTLGEIDLSIGGMYLFIRSCTGSWRGRCRWCRR